MPFDAREVEKSSTAVRHTVDIIYCTVSRVGKLLPTLACERSVKLTGNRYCSASSEPILSVNNSSAEKATNWYRMVIHLAAIPVRSVGLPCRVQVGGGGEEEMGTRWWDTEAYTVVNW